MSIFLDTDIFINFLRGQQFAKIFLSKIIGGKERVFFSAITEAELLSGQSCNDAHIREEILSLLGNFEKIEVSNPVAQMAGFIRRSYATPLADAIIAATALKMDATLYTGNVKDFKNIPHLNLENPRLV